MTTKLLYNSNEQLLLSARRKARKTAVDYIVKYSVAVLLLCIVLLPVVFMLFQSVMTYTESSGLEMHLFPHSFQPSNYKIITGYLSQLGNTLLVVAINAFFIPLTACITAFPFARAKFIGKKIAFAVILATVMVPASVLQIPTYTLYATVGLTGKLVSLWIQAFFGGGALNIFLVIQFMRTLPKELDEAALIDGASLFRIFAVIIMPLVFNVFVYICINTVIAQWMDFQGPLMYLSSGSEKSYTLALKFYVDYTNSTYLSDHYNEMMAMVVCMSLPPVALFLVFQQRMIGGIKIGGLKD